MAATFVRFSRVAGQPTDALASLDEAVANPWQCAVREVVRLRPSTTGAYDGGLELNGEFEPCTSVVGALESMEGADAFALLWAARAPRAWFHVNVFDIDDTGFSASMSVESSMVYFQGDGFDEGRWLEGLLTSVVCGLRPDVCGYGRDPAYRLRHAPMDPAEVLQRLRSGELLSLLRPTFHAISTELLPAAEIHQLVSEHRPSPDPEYRQAPGYHVLGRVR